MGKRLTGLSCGLGDKTKKKGEIFVREKEEVGKMLGKEHGMNKTDEDRLLELIARNLGGLTAKNSKPFAPVGLSAENNTVQALSRFFTKSKNQVKGVKVNLGTSGKIVFSETILKESLEDLKNLKAFMERKMANKQHLYLLAPLNKIKGLIQQNKAQTDFFVRQKLFLQRLVNDRSESKDATSKTEINKKETQYSRKKLLSKAVNTKSPTLKNLNSRLKIDFSPKLIENICGKNQEGCGGYSARESRTPSTTKRKSASNRKSEKVLKGVHEASHVSNLKIKKKGEKKQLNLSLKLIKYEEVNNQSFN